HPAGARQGHRRESTKGDALERLYFVTFSPQPTSMKQSTSHFHEFNGLRHHVRTWGSPEAPKLILLHGWMDVSASFQFLVDSLTHEWHVIAPDFRGFGLSQWTREGYWFPDYYADLERLLDIYHPGGAASIVGHS